jgi:lantibiotic biosynthesis protein
MVFSANTITDSIRSLDQDIRQQYTRNTTLYNKNTGLISGLPGLALFYGYLAKHFNEQQYLTQSQQFMEICIDVLDQNIQPSLFAGFTGTAWTIRHLVNQGIYDNDSLAVLEEIDPVIEKFAELYIQEKYYSHMYGFIGQGLYFLEALDSPTPAAIDPVKGLQKIVTALYTLQKKDSSGLITWEDITSRNIKKSTSPIYNLGIPHGVTGIINFLSSVYQRGIEPDLIRELIQGSTAWLIQQKNNFYDISFYPSLIGQEYPPHLTRLGWSYGDLCSAVALLKASIVLNDGALKEEAHTTALLSTKRNLRNSNIYRKKTADAEYLDIGLCKGTAGIIALYGYLLPHFPEAPLEEARQYWLDLTLQNKTRVGETNTYKSYVSLDGETGIWTDDIGLLEGTSGLGLTLMSLENPQLKAWQNILLL